MNELGPLAALEGNWEGNVGVDSSYNYTDEKIIETGYFEKARFSRIPVVGNGAQRMHGLNYEMTAWRHGEEDGDPFHDEVGYLLWDAATGTAMRCFAVPRGLAILMQAPATAESTELDFRTEPGSPTYGLVQNPYLLDHARAVGFRTTFTLGAGGTLAYVSTLTLELAAIGARMDHTDTNVLHRVEG